MRAPVNDVLFHQLVFDVSVPLLSLNPSNEGKVNDLREVPKGIRTLRWVEVMDVHQTILHSIRNHVILERVVDKIGFEAEVCRNL